MGVDVAWRGRVSCRRIAALRRHGGDGTGCGESFDEGKQVGAPDQTEAITDEDRGQLAGREQPVDGVAPTAKLAGDISNGEHHVVPSLLCGMDVSHGYLLDRRAATTAVHAREPAMCVRARVVHQTCGRRSGSG